MWESLHSETGAWDKEIQSAKGDHASHIAVSHSICAASKFNEVFIGGDDSPCILQILAAGVNAEDTDILASVLLPSDPVEVVYTARGSNVVKLLHSFWSWRPSAPVVTEQNGQYTPLLCDLDGHEWTVGLLSAAHIQKILKFESLDDCMSKLRIYSDALQGAKLHKSYV